MGVLSECMSIDYMPAWCPQWPEDVRRPGTGITDTILATMWMLRMEPRSLKLLNHFSSPRMTFRDIFLSLDDIVG